MDKITQEVFSSTGNEMRIRARSYRIGEPGQAKLKDCAKMEKTA